MFPLFEIISEMDFGKQSGFICAMTRMVDCDAHGTICDVDASYCIHRHRVAYQSY